MARLAGRLDVFLNSRVIGRLSRAASGAVDFQYDPTWLVWDHTLPISLSLPLRERRYIGAPVLAVFDNLLPDNDGLVENEYLCLKLTAALGVPSARAEIATFGAKNVLIVERFDRLITQDKRIIRVPQEDCCQALTVPWTRKYESDGGPGIPAILKLLAGSDMAASDQRSFLKANIIFWLLGATDGHAKNFSLFLSPGGGYRLTPIYDVVSAEPRLAMAVGESRHDQIKTIAPRHFVESAVLGGVGRNLAMEVIEELASVGQAAFDATVAALPAAFPEALVAGIAKGFAERLRLLSGAEVTGEA